MLKIDLNCDLGESFGVYKIGADENVIPLISSANVACGFHASDPVIMEKTVDLCRRNNVSVGAHPGFPDLLGFGRREMTIKPGDAKAYVMYQAGALSAFCVAAGIKMAHVKLHGALYNMAARDYNLARAICDGVAATDKSLIMLVLAGSCMETAARDAGLRVAREFFADRAYQDDASLVPRSQPGSVIEDENEAVLRVLSVIRHGCVTSSSGREIEVHADSVCIHGDNARALDFAKLLRRSLDKEGIRICSMGEFL